MAIVIAAGVIADVAVRVISVDNTAGTCVIRVIDNNGGFLSPNFALPMSVIRPVAFEVALGDVLEELATGQRTAVVRWVDGVGQWSESPTGVPPRDTLGWRKLGTFPLP